MDIVIIDSHTHYRVQAWLFTVSNKLRLLDMDSAAQVMDHMARDWDLPPSSDNARLDKRSLSYLARAIQIVAGKISNSSLAVTRWGNAWDDCREADYLLQAFADANLLCLGKETPGDEAGGTTVM